MTLTLFKRSSLTMLGFFGRVTYKRKTFRITAKDRAKEFHAVAVLPIRAVSRKKSVLKKKRRGDFLLKKPQRAFFGRNHHKMNSGLCWGFTAVISASDLLLFESQLCL